MGIVVYGGLNSEYCYKCYYTIIICIQNFLLLSSFCVLSTYPRPPFRDVLFYLCTELKEGLLFVSW